MKSSCAAREAGRPAFDQVTADFFHNCCAKCLYGFELGTIQMTHNRLRKESCVPTHQCRQRVRRIGIHPMRFASTRLPEHPDAQVPSRARQMHRPILPQARQGRQTSPGSRFMRCVMAAAMPLVSAPQLAGFIRDRKQPVACLRQPVTRLSGLCS